MPKRVAVVTDAVSEQFNFPYWHRYYGDQFGTGNLFVVTYAGKAGLFAGFAVGGLIELPVGFEEELRAAFVSRFVSTLLACYDVVVRVDADEFLVVDPTVAPSLSAFVETMSEPYLTARGFDVVQLPGELRLIGRPGTPLLQDRGHAYPNTALNKTCLVTTPMQWSVGFHWASVFPRFGPVFMLHMKRVDIDWQMAHLRQMTADFDANPLVGAQSREYHSADEARIRAYHAGVDERPRLSGLGAWYRHGLIASFLAEIRLDPVSGCYHGQYGHELVLCEIVRDWKRAL